MLVFESAALLHADKRAALDNIAVTLGFMQESLVPEDTKYPCVLVIRLIFDASFAPATATAINPNWLYFAAGPDDEEEGLFGFNTKE